MLPNPGGHSCDTCSEVDRLRGIEVRAHLRMVREGVDYLLARGKVLDDRL